MTRSKAKKSSKQNDTSRNQKMFKINLVNDKLTRKQKRKEMRTLKKMKKNAFCKKEVMPNLDEYLEKKKKTFQAEIDQKTKKKQKIQNKIDKVKEKKVQKKLERDQERERQEAEREEEREEKRIHKAEDKSLKDLEKKLNLNKKRKSLPLGFMNDGLDYLLEVIDGKTDIDYEKEKPDWLNESDEEEFSKDAEFRQDDANSDEEDDLMEEPGDDSGEENTSAEEDNSDDPGDDFNFSDKDDDDDLSEIERSKADTITPKSILKNKKSSDKKHISWNEELEQSQILKNKKNVKNSKESQQESKNVNLKRKTEESESESEEEELKEDIYGRVKSSKSVTSHVEGRGGGAYIPPAKRAMMMGDSEDRKLILEKLKKQMKGLINRVSESNLQSISNQIGELYLFNSRADVNQTLTELIMASCIATTLTPERLGQELVLLLSVLHCKIGLEVGAYFLQTIVSELNEYLSQPGYGPGKMVDNILLLITTLYNYQVIHSTMIFDIILKLLESFTERDIELLLFIIKNVGFNLRKDDPVKLKEVILLMQTKAADVENSGLVEKSRVQFMLEIILAIKNNNMRKIPNYDPSRSEHLKKLLHNLVKGLNMTSNQLCVGLKDILEAQNKGKWWLVGSAWSGRENTNTSDTAAVSSESSKILSEANTALLKLAQKQRMNTDTRKCIFLILMTSEDFVDAFEKLLRLGLKNQQEREIIHVIMSCCLQEKEYNPYYAHLVQKFCQFDRRFQMTLQYYLWDKFKEMINLSERNINNLVSVINHQIINEAVTLSILKVIEFGTLDKPMVNFLKVMLEQILLDNTDEVIQTVFLKITANDKLRHLQEGLKLFMVHFLLKKKSKTQTDSDISVKLAEKIRVAENTLSEGHRKMLL